MLGEAHSAAQAAGKQQSMKMIGQKMDVCSFSALFGVEAVMAMFYLINR